MGNVGKMIGKSAMTVDRMILFFIETGIIYRCHNYMVGKQTYFYHKNGPLFDHMFKAVCSDYYDWISSNKSNVNSKVYNTSNVNTNRNPKVQTTQGKRGRKPRTYTPDYKLLSKIENEFIPIIDSLNRKQHEKLQMHFDLRFNERGNFTGRSNSFFCFTLNEKNKENYDTTMMPRSMFLKNMGLG